MVTTKEKIDLFRKRRKKALLGTGELGLEKQHKKGKLTARERVALLVDFNSWQEVNLFVKHRATNFGIDKIDIPSEGVITGVGRVGDKIIYIASQDFTARGGSVGEMHAEKICAIMDMALKTGDPIVMFNDSGGARIQEGVDSLSGYGKIFYRNTLLSGVVPQIAVVAGPCAGGAAYSPALMDFIIMVRGKSQMYITGPQVIKEVTGENIDGESLGGADVNAQLSGNIHFVAQDDQDAANIVKKLLYFLPSNNTEDGYLNANQDIIWNEDIFLNNIIPDNSKSSYSMHKIIQHISDNGDFLEIKAQFAKNIIVGFSKVNGITIGIVANNPLFKAGVLDIDASDKSSEFIRFCNVFNIPIVTFVDVPGFMPGIEQEYGGVIRHGAKMLFAYAASTVPKITIITRKAYGGAYLAMSAKSMGTDRVAAWPTAEIAVMGAQGAANIIFRKEILKSKNPEETKQKRIEEYQNEFSTPYIAASRGLIDSIIEPKDTRRYIALSLDILKSKSDIRPPKKHGLIPM